MRAMICRQWGEPEDLRLEEVDAPPLGPGQVRIRIKAAGVSFATTLVIAGKYQRRPPLPFAPGTEATGIVTEVGPDCRRLKAGDEVVAGVLVEEDLDGDEALAVGVAGLAEEVAGGEGVEGKALG